MLVRITCILLFSLLGNSALYAQFAGIKIDTLYHGNDNQLQGYRTYQIYVMTQHESDMVYKVFGGGGAPPLELACTGQLYQHPQAGALSLGISQEMLLQDTMLVHDSYVTIGYTNDQGMEVLPEIQNLLIVDQEVDFTEFETGAGSVYIDGVEKTGWWVPVGAMQSMSGVGKKVLIAQLTSSAEITGNLNFIIFSEHSGGEFVYAGMNLHGIQGCTIPDTPNYNPEAVIYDGSCTNVAVADDILGCTDPQAANYDPSADEDDGSCLYPGCTDPQAFNYNPEANTDNGSCITDCGQIVLVPAINQQADNSVLPLCGANAFGEYEFMAAFTGYGDGLSQVEVEWGDGTGSVFGLPLFDLYHLYQSPGDYALTISITGIYGCTRTFSYTVRIGGEPGGELITPGVNNALCAGESIFATLIGWENNPAGTQYIITKSDGSEPMVFNHPPPTTVEIAFDHISCQFTGYDGTENAVGLRMSAVNACGTTQSEAGSFFVSGTLPGAETTMFSAADALSFCPGEEISFVNISSGYILAEAGGCSQNQSQQWAVFPNEGFEITGGGIDQAFIDIAFNSSGNYEVKLIGSNMCGGGINVESVEVFTNEGFVSGVVSLSGEHVVSMPIGVYQYSNVSGEFGMSHLAQTDDNGAFELQLGAGSYQIKTLPAEEEYPGILPMFTNEVWDWLEAEVFEVGCGTVDNTDIQLPEMQQNGVDVIIGGGVYYRDFTKGPWQGDPIPGIPIIVEKDSSDNDTVIATAKDLLGNYLIANLAPGSYRLHVDIPGLPMAETHFFTVEENGLEVMGLNFYADSLGMIYITDYVALDIEQEPVSSPCPVRPPLPQS